MSSDDPFAAFTNTNSKASGAKGSTPGALNASADPFAAFTTPTQSSTPVDPFAAFSSAPMPKTSSAPDPFAFPSKVSASSDPFATFSSTASQPSATLMQPASQPIRSPQVTAGDPFAGVPVVSPYSKPSRPTAADNGTGGLVESESTAKASSTRGSFVNSAPTIVRPPSATVASASGDLLGMSSMPTPPASSSSSNPFSNTQSDDPFSSNISSSSAIPVSTGDGFISPPSKPEGTRKVSTAIPASASSASFVEEPTQTVRPVAKSSSADALRSMEAPAFTAPKLEPPPKVLRTPVSGRNDRAGSLVGGNKERLGPIIASKFSSSGDEFSSPETGKFGSEDRNESPVVRAKRNKRTEHLCRDYTGPKTQLSGKTTGPFWTQHAFFDLFIGEKKSRYLARNVDSDMHPIHQLRNSMHFVHAAISSQLELFQAISVQNLPSFATNALSALYEACNLLDRYPLSPDPTAVLLFLDYFIPRMRALRLHEFLFFPCTWYTSLDFPSPLGFKFLFRTSEGKVFAILLVIMKTSEGTDANYSVAAVNTQENSGGLDFHAVRIDADSGEALRNLSLEINFINNEKILNAPFW